MATRRKKTGSPLERVRSICMSLPEVEERLSHGAPSFFAGGKKTIAMFVDDHHGDGKLGIWTAAPPGEQEALIAQDPGRYFRPPYVGVRGWIGVCIDDTLSDTELSEILETAYRCVAPKKLIAQLDEK
jgi:hypothetical protein